MVKVTLLGDSIRRIGYGNVVPQLLGSDFEVFQPDDNCRFAKYTLRGLFDWRAGMEGTRIVHWNNGLWDVCDIMEDGRMFTSVDEYVDNMLRIADVLLKRYEKVIFATTTPVTEQNSYNKNDIIEEYNNAIVPRLMEKGIIINDLYSTVAADIDRFICEDNIHLSDEGVKICAEQVANIIKKVASTLSDETNGDSADNNNFAGAPV